MQMSQASIVFSNYLAKLIAENDEKSLKNFTVIYSWCRVKFEYAFKEKGGKRRHYCLPLNRKIALFFGFMTHTKGWDILNNLDIPDDWAMVINQSENLFNTIKPSSIDGHDNQKRVSNQKGRNHIIVK